MYDIYPIDSETISQLESLYQGFQQVAQTEYGWPVPPIAFKDLTNVFKQGILQGYLIRDYHQERCVGFMLYQREAYGSLEVKVIFMEPELPVKAVMDDLMNRFLEDIKHMDSWEVISYPMLGEGQRRYTDYMTWYGFQLVGQAVVRFHMDDIITQEVFQRQTFTPLPPGYRLLSWEPQYEEGVVEVLTESFKESVDALWDLRFRTREGLKEALQFVQSGNYGLFWPLCTTILLDADSQPVGICLLNIVSPEELNIPLIGILKREQHRKLGRTLLGATIEKCLMAARQQQVPLKAVTATVATANVPAIKMYRYSGFQEDHWYPHAYQERSSVVTRKPGQWC